MKLRSIAVLAGVLLAVSACMIEPYGGGDARGHYYGGGYSDHDYGRRVWQQ